MRGPAKTIQELAGHNRLSTTMKYMHLTKGAKASAIALLSQPWTEDDGHEPDDVARSGSEKRKPVLTT